MGRPRAKGCQSDWIHTTVSRQLILVLYGCTYTMILLHLKKVYEGTGRWEPCWGFLVQPDSKLGDMVVMAGLEWAIWASVDY